MKQLTNISNRIKEITNLIPKCETLFDVGCDHGKLGAYCLFRGVCKNVVLSDISQTNLDKAVYTARHLPQQDLTFICCAGIPQMVQTVDKHNSIIAICGLGAETIIDILRDCESKQDIKFVLQPATKEERLREFLINEDFEIIKEVIIKENDNFYCTMLVSYPRTKQRAKDDAMFLGFVDDSQSLEVYNEYLHKKLNIAKKMMSIKKRKKQDKLFKSEDYERQYASISERIKGE